MKELFDSLNAFSKEVQKRYEVKRLENQNYDLNTQCGSCARWMIKSQCKRESNHLVSSTEFKCSDFHITNHSKKLIEANNIKIKELKSES